jgi:hypothetical protein
MLGSNPSAVSVASTDRRGMLRHPLRPASGGPNALNPRGAGANPRVATRFRSESRASSDNACFDLLS